MIIFSDKTKTNSILKNQRILFVTTKNLDYIRNTQEIRLLSQYANPTIIGSDSKSYPLRLLWVFWKLLMTRLSCYDILFFGFSPQLILYMPFMKSRIRAYQKNKTASSAHLVVMDFFISMYDTLVCDRQKFSPGSVPARILHHMDETTLRCADMVICDTNTHGAYFTAEFGIAAEKLETLYLEADSSIYSVSSLADASINSASFKADSINNTAASQPDSDINSAASQADSDVNSAVSQPDSDICRTDRAPFRVLYFGSVLPLQGVDTVLKAASLITNASSKIEFVIIGPIHQKYEKPDSPLITYHEWLSQEALAVEIAKADLCLAGHFNGSIEKAKRTIPGKAYIYRAMNKPMILGDNPANRELFSEDMEGIYFVPMSDAKALADKIQAIAG